MILDAHQLRIELPAAWSGRIWARAHDVATLHLANYGLSLSDGEFGDASTAKMAAGGSFLALTEYRPGAGLAPGRGLFAPGRIPRRLDPTAFKSTGLAHPRAGQVGMQHFFTAARRPFCLYVVLAGPRHARRGQLAAVDQVLCTLSIRPRE
ncbi:MAG: hypothetical protein M3Z06_11690 [Actinomycetota bacterium]|nr:hypothetical protein [Actinomycetota bacterium]